MKLLTAHQTKNDCYRTARVMPKGKPVGIVVHSTGANNPTLKRYVELPEELGKNLYNNHWNKSGVQKMVHAFIGYDKNNTVTVVNTLPYNLCCWGCSKGNKGSYNFNPAYVQFEICEDNLKNETYFDDAFKAAIEYCAYLCKKFDIPVSKIVSHKEAHAEGYASNHGDPENWLTKHGKNMAWFRAEVADLLTDNDTGTNDEEFTAGEIVNFNGGYVYSSANGSAGKNAKMSLAKITRVFAGKHPYHIRAVDENGNYTAGVYGWVNADKLQKTAELKPYTVKVNASTLNIRSGAGTNYKVTGTIRNKGVYTIVAEATGNGATKWGKLKSGAGWISLDRTTKL